MENVWLNFPVEDLEKTEKFYLSLGFKSNGRKNEKLVSIKAGSNDLIVNFFKTEAFEKSAEGKATDTSKSNEIMISIGVKTTEEVSKLAEKARQHGGKVFSEPKDFEMDGVTYHGCGFSDPDGHKWNVLRMEEGM